MFTADNIVLNIDLVVSFRVVDAKLAVYSVTNYINGIEQVVVSAMRDNVAGKTFETAIRSRK